MHVILLRIVCNTNTFVLLVGIVAYIFKKATPIFSPPEGGFILAPRYTQIIHPIIGLSPDLADNPILSAAVFSFPAGRISCFFCGTYGSFSS
jgi:hypothetical protein